MTRIDEIKARLKAATPGPWVLNDDLLPIEVWTFPQTTHVAILDQRADFAPGKTSCFHNADLIANAPADLAFLIAENDKLAGALQRILDEGNLAAQGHWDSTDKMKAMAYHALTKLEAAVKEMEHNANPLK